MSKESVLAFLSKANGDADLQKQTKRVEGNLGKLIRVAGNAGFTFTAEDWNAAIADLAAQGSDELNEKTLDQVVGGAFQAHIVIKGTKQGK